MITILGWIGLFAVLLLGLVVLVSLVRMSRRQDHEARKEELKRIPDSDVEVTQTGQW